MLYNRDYRLFFLSVACVRTDAATALTALELLGFESSLEAIVAIAGDVFSFFAMIECHFAD